MSDYLAWFGAPPPPQANGTGWIKQADAPGVARDQMECIAMRFGFGEGFFVVDETGDTAQELINEIWKKPQLAAYAGSRIEKIVEQAMEAKATLATFEATWALKHDGPLPIVESYRAFGENLVQYVIGSGDLEAICKPR